jgi:hypothetical protein
MDDFVLLVIKWLFFLNIVENLRMKQFVLKKDLCVGFPLCKTLIEEFCLLWWNTHLKKFLALCECFNWCYTYI